MARRDLAAYFYANDGLIASTHLERLQRMFGFLVSLFDQVGLRTNARKTVSMEFHPCNVSGQMSSEAYERRTTGMGPNFQERQRRRLM